MEYSITIGKCRNGDVGDWYKLLPDLRCIVSAEMGNPDYNFLIILHEMVEQHLCERDGVTDEEVTAWDATCPDVEPGMHPDAPYHKQHLAAIAVEQMAAKVLGVDWDLYNDATLFAGIDE